MKNTVEINTMWLAILVGFVATITLTILAYKFIIPEKRRPHLNKLGKFLHDAFNFKFLIIEKVLQFFYVLATIAVVSYGISMILGVYIYHSKYFSTTEWYGIYGILSAIVGPIAIRMTYEMILMFVLLVKNVMQINKKLESNGSEEYQFPAFKDLISKENFEFMKKANNNNEPVVAQPNASKDEQESSN